MEQALAALKEELEQEVQELAKSRSIEDRATRIAEEMGISKVRACYTTALCCNLFSKETMGFSDETMQPPVSNYFRGAFGLWTI